MLRKRGCPPMSHIWGEKAQNLKCSHRQDKSLVPGCRPGRAGTGPVENRIQSFFFPTVTFCLLAYLYCHIAFSDFPHVETNCGNHVFTELAWLRKRNGRQKAAWHIKCDEMVLEIFISWAFFLSWCYLITTICVLTFIQWQCLSISITT